VSFPVLFACGFYLCDYSWLLCDSFQVVVVSWLNSRFFGILHVQNILLTDIALVANLLAAAAGYSLGIYRTVLKCLI